MAVFEQILLFRIFLLENWHYESYRLYFYLWTFLQKCLQILRIQFLYFPPNNNYFISFVWKFQLSLNFLLCCTKLCCSVYIKMSLNWSPFSTKQNLIKYSSNFSFYICHLFFSNRLKTAIQKRTAVFKSINLYHCSSIDESNIFEELEPHI